MSNVSLEQVKELAQQLSPEDRRELFYFLLELPDSGIPSQKLEPPPFTLDDAKETEASNANGDNYVVISTDRMARLMLKGRTIFDVFYYPENFRQSRMEIRSWKDAPPSERMKIEFRSMLELFDSQRELTEEEIITLLKQSQARVYAAETYQISQELSSRLPQITSLLFDAAVVILELKVRSAIAEQTGRQKKTLEQMVEVLQPYWKQIQAYLQSPFSVGDASEIEWGTKGTVAEGDRQLTEEHIKYFFDVTSDENTVIGHIEGIEIFRLTFNHDNFAENLSKTWPSPKPSESAIANVRSMLKEHDPERSDEEINAWADRFHEIMMKVVTEEKAKHIAERISENLDSLLIAVMEDAIKAYGLEGTILLNEQAGKQINISQYKDIILKQHWSRIRDLAGIKQGGARKRKGFVWTNERKIAFYEKVEALPKHKDKPVWQYLLEELIEQEFDADTIAWLRTRPAVKDIPKELFDRAVKTWRKHLADESWNQMKPEDKPRAFEFCHALHLLDYPQSSKYKTLETYYYEGKNLSDKQT